MNTQNNARTQNTLRQLENALISLLETNTLSSISVRDLCIKAGVSRTMFYAHYRNVIEMTECILKQKFDSLNFPLMTSLKSGSEETFGKKISETIVSILQKVRQNKTLCGAFLKDEKLFFKYQEHLEKIDAHIIGRLYAQGENGNKVAFRVR